MSSGSVILFTSSYPYGKGEQFLEAEIPILSQKFSKVIIFPVWPGSTIREVPANCEVVPLTAEFVPKKKFRFYILKHALRIAGVMSYILFTTTQRKYYLKNLRKCVVDLTFLFEEGELYERTYSQYFKQSSVMYFYWFARPFTHFALLKRRGKIDHRLVSRGLGYDYDPIQNELGLFPFREIEMPYLNNLVTNSKWGMQLVQKLYPSHSSKVSFSYLGLPWVKELNPENRTKVFHLVSCAYVIDIKRVHLIVDILKHISFPVKWTHIGEGPLLDDVKKQAQELPAHVQVHLPGYIPSVMEFYRTEPCDLFITTTWTEGLPFSLNEAIAYGIPVMGTAVCGIPEIVNDRTGFIIPRDFEPEKAAEIISSYKMRPAEEKAELRRSARAFYESTFTAEKNIAGFIETYLN